MMVSLISPSKTLSSINEDAYSDDLMKLINKYSAFQLNVDVVKLRGGLQRMTNKIAV